MNQKAAKMIRQIPGSIKKHKKQWKTFPHTLRGVIRKEYNESTKLTIIRPPSWPNT